MVKALVMGAAGELGSHFVTGLLERGIPVTAVSRSPLKDEVADALMAAPAGSAHQLVVTYLDVVFDGRYDYVFFTTGVFQASRLVSLCEGDMRTEIEENVTEPLILTSRLLRPQSAPHRQRTDYIYIGSTAAYSGFSDMSVYCASKFALRGFVESMNAEYSGTGIRFWLVSMGTMNTPMGRTYAGSIGRRIETLIDPGYVAHRVLSSVLDGGDAYEPEMMVRMR